MTYGPPLGGMCDPSRPKKKKAQPEKAVQKAIQHAFRLQHGIALVHVDSGAAGMRQGRAAGQGGYSSTPAGFPDLVGCLPPSGRAVYVEVKRLGGKPTPAQVQMLAMLRSKGAIAFVADSVQSALDQFEEQARRCA